MSERAAAQRAQVAGCREAMPAQLEPLWQTIVHAPDEVLLDVADALAASHPDPSARLVVFLAWLGHGDGTCPVCWMLTGRLPYTIPLLGAQLPLALAGAEQEVGAAAWRGAGRFLAKRLEPRHALPCGISRERLVELVREVRALAPAFKQDLRARWLASGGTAEELELLD